MASTGRTFDSDEIRYSREICTVDHGHDLTWENVASDPKSRTTYVRQCSAGPADLFQFRMPPNDIDDLDVAKPVPFSTSREELS